VLYRKRDPNVGANGVPNFQKAPISDSIKIKGQFFLPKIPGGYPMGIILKNQNYENGKHFPFS
jgi:hypothetical protein